MRFGIFADIHANLEAMEAVVTDMENEGVNQPLCAGDIVGYNGSPVDCVEFVQSLRCPVVMGNHDQAATWALDPLNFNSLAKEALAYTKSQLSPEHMEYLAALPLLKHFEGFTMVHSELVTPDAWKYLMTPDDALPSLQRQRFPLAFFGHTHLPHMFVHDGHWVREYFYKKFIIHPDKKYFVNVGSVGQPRDNDWRSSYVIYDTDENSIELRRVEYDLTTAQKKIIEAGLSPRLAERLELGV